MHRDFEITSGIYLSQGSHELDLHNDFDFQAVQYCVTNRTLSVHWRRSSGEWVASGTPAAVCVEFREVSEFRFLPRDPEMPFTEDDCVSTFGYWTDEAWAGNGVLVVDPSQTPGSSWLTAIGFMSGARILVQAGSAHALVES